MDPSEAHFVDLPEQREALWQRMADFLEAGTHRRTGTR